MNIILLNNYTAIYWLTRLNYINDFLVIIGIGLACLSLGMFFFSFMEGEWMEDDGKALKSNGKKTAIIATILLSIRLFIPTKEEVVMIYAGGKTMDFVQSDTSLSKIPSQTTKIITDYLEKQIKETSKEDGKDN